MEPRSLTYFPFNGASRMSRLHIPTLVDSTTDITANTLPGTDNGCARVVNLARSSIRLHGV